MTLDRPPLRLDAPAFLRPEASILRGRSAHDLYSDADETVRREPFDTQLVRRVAERVKPAVLSIYVKTATPVRVHLLPIPFLPGLRVRLPGRGLGSGFFIHPSGYLLTNNHVIENAHDVVVMTRDGDEYGVVIVARDPVWDLALLRVRGSHGPFPIIPIGDSGDVGVGDLAIAVGNPLGLGHTVTSGIVSSTGRNLSGVPAEQRRSIELFQTDTPINPGSSGGPLVSLTGACVGLNTAGIPTAQNIGFAVPARYVREFLTEVLAGQGEAEGNGD